ncbi:hypothetical protein ACVRZR_06200 [Streptococcus entericus]|uniref:hypothetical protein n=1 Tax=Streptococcus entericus TaxID=155680 RepID=UPI00037F856E|nr:hypothetical protein [Streptococcus entericus]
MKKELSYLKIVVPILKVIAIIQSIGLAVGVALATFFSINGVDKGWKILTSWAASTGGTITGKFPDIPHPIFLWVGIFHGVLILMLMILIRKFCQNLVVGKIFVPANVTLTRQASLVLLINGFISVTGVIGEISVGGIDLLTLLAALAVFTISKILEQANAIAEENDFTI